MKKSTRLNHMMTFINEHQEFKLIDLMNEFNISRSTALRDIKDLEKLGIPLYSTNGKHGGYKVIRDRYVTKIGFTDEEIVNMMFALNSISSIKRLPFQVTYEQLYRKLYQNIAANQKALVKQYENKFRYFNSENMDMKNNLMEEILTAIVSKKFISLKYGERNYNNIIGIGYIYKNNKWYLVIYDEKNNIVKILDNNKIQSLLIGEFIKKEIPVDLSCFEAYMIKGESIQIEIMCDEIGISNIQNYLWTKYSIEKVEEGIFNFKTLINKNDIDFIAQLLYRESLNIIDIKPKVLKDALIKAMKINVKKLTDIYY
ncbi:HTH domain-containing protein [Macrococcoides bohemicum]|uniref:HTH domain-containing protein n=1 Tax=Macrococcoides bohemicum TaxID=1903056 RepID=A0AAJ4PBA6_9STAP|nr:HTH domain-containing protein [Macrococcus bohemicus]QYA42708.1 HTH domain-containing protein [Macrococcus bohemicus]